MIKKSSLALITLLFILIGCKKDNSAVSNTQQGASLILNKSNIALFLGYADTLQATIQPSSASITWTTSNDSVATVSNGQILAVGKGTATIKAETTEDKTASCTVTVTDMSDVIGASAAYLLLTDSTEEAQIGIGNTSPYDMIINRYTLYSTHNAVINDQVLSGNSAIVISHPISVITSYINVGIGNLNILEPGDTKGVVSWKTVLYFDYNSKKYKMTVAAGYNSFTVQ